MNQEELLKMHENTCNKCRRIMERKNSDYTGGKEAEDVFANFRSATYLGVHPVTGILMRVMDKIQRIRTFTNDGALSVSDESVDDAFEDIFNYAILGKAMLKQEKREQPDPLTDPLDEIETYYRLSTDHKD